jgi:chromate reductase, NAD(P)H dehydrogenase (quinone)
MFHWKDGISRSRLSSEVVSEATVKEMNMWNTDETVRITGISDSLRSASFSTGLLKILARKAAPAMKIEVVTLDCIPLYNEDLDQEPEIAAVAKFKGIIAASDGVLIATPEYNHGIPGVLKNGT